jgi:hypothetical protein
MRQGAGRAGGLRADRSTIPQAYLAYPCERSHATRRSPFIQSSTSALLFRPVISRGSAPGYSARICQSSSAFRTALNVTFAFAIRCYARFYQNRTRFLESSVKRHAGYQPMWVPELGPSSGNPALGGSGVSIGKQGLGDQLASWIRRARVQKGSSRNSKTATPPERSIFARRCCRRTGNCNPPVRVSPGTCEKVQWVGVPFRRAEDLAVRRGADLTRQHAGI